ncbi:MAG: methyltransferase domain-containing protein [Chlorobiaceae bacterium]|nr:methyltransferase domain-containing protein [Chlorobiaceae bacterium]
MTDHRYPSRDNASREWFEDWFSNPLYLKVYHHRDSAEAELCVETILRITGTPTNSLRPVLDIACGAGRHAIAMAHLGLQVTANDLSAFLLGLAEKEAENRGLDIEFTCSDMRSISLEREFDLIVQLFSSFGYFETDEEDQAVIRNVAEMLSPEGWYVLDLINPQYLKKHIVLRTEKSVDTLSITEERELTDRNVCKTITIKDVNGDECSYSESMRLFSPAEISTLLESENLEVKFIAGDYRGHEFQENTSPRMILFTRKKRKAPNVL